MKTNDKSSVSFLKIILWPFKSYLRIMAVVGFIGFYQYQSIEVDILAREIRNLELKRDQLLNRRADLQVKIDQLTHIDRIESVARDRFGLVSSGKDHKQLVIKKYSPQPSKNIENLEMAGVR